MRPGSQPSRVGDLQALDPDLSMCGRCIALAQVRVGVDARFESAALRFGNQAGNVIAMLGWRSFFVMPVVVLRKIATEPARAS